MRRRCTSAWVGSAYSKQLLKVEVRRDMLNRKRMVALWKESDSRRVASTLKRPAVEEMPALLKSAGVKVIGVTGRWSGYQLPAKNGESSFFMVRIVPYVLPVMLLGATFQLYFRSSVKSKRDLMHMLDNETEIVAKNATEARTRQAKREMRDERLGAISEVISHYRTSWFNVVLNSTLGLWDDWVDSMALYRAQRQKRRALVVVW